MTACAHVRDSKYGAVVVFSYIPIVFFVLLSLALTWFVVIIVVVIKFIHSVGVFMNTKKKAFSFFVSPLSLFHFHSRKIYLMTLIFMHDWNLNVECKWFCNVFRTEPNKNRFTDNTVTLCHAGKSLRSSIVFFRSFSSFFFSFLFFHWIAFTI